MRQRFLAAIALALVSMLAFGCGDDDDAFIVDDESVIAFDDFDLNDDGFVSLAEWETMNGVLDIDADGTIDTDEFADDAFEDFDRDDDAFVSTDEWGGAFDDFDLDEDGLVGFDEFF